MPFYYLGWWANAVAMLDAAITSETTAFAASSAFDSLSADVASDGPTRWSAAGAVHGYRHNGKLTRTPGGDPFWTITEGGFGYLSTVDVAYEVHPFQTEFEPWKSEARARPVEGALRGRR